MRFCYLFRGALLAFAHGHPEVVGLHVLSRLGRNFGLGHLELHQQQAVQRKGVKLAPFLFGAKHRLHVAVAEGCHYDAHGAPWQVLVFREPLHQVSRVQRWHH